MSYSSDSRVWCRRLNLVIETIRGLFRKRGVFIRSVLDELESLKPEFQCCVNEHNEADAAYYQPELESTSYSSQTSSLEWPPVNNKSLSMNLRQPTSVASLSSLKYRNDFSRGTTSSIQIDKQFQNLSFNLPIPNKETLTRHSFLGPNGLRGQWRGPISQVKVQYPSSTDIVPTEISGHIQTGQYDPLGIQEGDPGGMNSIMESVLSLDNGEWLRPTQESSPSWISEAKEDCFPLVKQPSPPPVLAQVQQEVAPIHHSKVADPRPGLANPSQDGIPGSSSFQHLHVYKISCSASNKNDGGLPKIGSEKY